MGWKALVKSLSATGSSAVVKGTDNACVYVKADREVGENTKGNKSAVQIRNAGVKQGMTLLRRDGWNKVKQGVTSIEEVLRVTGQ